MNAAHRGIHPAVRANPRLRERRDEGTVVDGRALRACLDAPVVIKDGLEALRWRGRELEQSDWVQPGHSTLTGSTRPP